jgi:multiple antibiotic resistance protein
LLLRRLVVVVLVFALLLALARVCLAAQLMRLFGPTGVNVVTRVLGIQPTALAVQFGSDGMLAM